MAPLTLVGQSRSVGDLARASSSPLDDYAAKEKAFLAASHDVKRPWLAGSLDHSKCIDANKGETLLNIVTSLVYNAAAFHIPKRADGQEEGLKRNLYRAALHGVGLAATFYHVVPAEKMPALRNFSRRCDYCSVATAYVAFTTAHGKLAGKTQNAVTALTTLALPFQPMVVAGIHTVATEIAFTKASMKNPKYKKDQIIHTASTLAAMTCFKAENKWKHNPLLHSMWHVFGAIAIHQANKVLMT